MVPIKLRKEIMNACHANQTACHLGQNKTFSRVRTSFMWPGMTEDVNFHVKSYAVCAKNKSLAYPPCAGLKEYYAGFPLERLHIDILGPFIKSALGNKYILMMVDQFTKWVDCAAIQDQKAETVALKFMDYFMPPLGPPLSIHTDQGSNFESGLFQAFCAQFQIAETMSDRLSYYLNFVEEQILQRPVGAFRENHVSPPSLLFSLFHWGTLAIILTRLSPEDRECLENVLLVSNGFGGSPYGSLGFIRYFFSVHGCSSC